jgi:hypothetical protein
LFDDFVEFSLEHIKIRQIARYDAFFNVLYLFSVVFGNNSNRNFLDDFPYNYLSLGLVQRYVQIVDSQIQISYFVLQVEDLFGLFPDESFAERQFHLQFCNLLLQVSNFVIKYVHMMRTHLGTYSV